METLIVVLTDTDTEMWGGIVEKAYLRTHKKNKKLKLDTIKRGEEGGIMT